MNDSSVPPCEEVRVATSQLKHNPASKITLNPKYKKNLHTCSKFQSINEAICIGLASLFWSSNCFNHFPRHITLLKPGRLYTLQN